MPKLPSRPSRLLDQVRVSRLPPAAAALGRVRRRSLAADEAVILLHPPLPLVGLSIVMDRERPQNDSLVNGYRGLDRDLALLADRERGEPDLAVGETVILLTPPLHPY